MVTRQENTEQNLTFGEVFFIKPADEEDREQGIDAWLGGIPFAWRRRRIPLNQHGELSIRFSIASGNRTEYHKLLDGSFKALIYVFQFSDAVVVCKTEDIVSCIRNQQYIVKQNHDGETSALYIKLTDIEHLMLPVEAKH
ncbi:MAG: hypothetical protein DDT31_01639 [Syntrophomonadaceae bacterium]|nr:hypothetical protein [Bacillota bacterium]